MANPVYDSCWGATPHAFLEFELSSCEFGCKVYKCHYCRQRQVLHNPSYGCKKDNVAGEVS